MGTLTITKNEQTYSFPFEENDTVLRILQKNGFPFHAACGGSQKCDHCMVIADGIKLRACQLMAKDGMNIILPNDAPDIDIELTVKSKLTHSDKKSSHYGIAADIGTTTIALSLIDLSNGAILASQGCMNPNISYGADVLSRIDASNNGHSTEIRRSLILALSHEIEALLDCTQIPFACLSSICIAANTTMCHLLLGLSCETLGKAPFSPVMTKYPKMSGNELFVPFGQNHFKDVTITLLPGLSAFIGGDITAGLFSLSPFDALTPFLFVDLGTNGEMVLGTSTHFFAASVAAGPAFEGSRIPGSVVLDGIYEMLKRKVLDPTGLLHGIFFHSGYRYQNHVFSQDEIRLIQLAKASVRGGIETLLLTSDLNVSDISKIYLCGGFGTHTNTDIAVSIGMFPETFRGKIVPLGNTALAGAIRYLVNEDMGFFKELHSRTQIVELAASPVYQDAYINRMNF